MRKPRVIAVIPAFNEARNMPRLLEQLETFRKTAPEWDFTPVIINDGSSDNSSEWLRQHAARSRVEFIDLPMNLGIGRAVQTGLRLARDLQADVALQLDGDGQHLASEIPKIAGPILSGAADVTVGSRYHAEGGGNVSTSLRQAGTLFFSGLIRMLTGRKILDVTSGFRAFSRPATEFLAEHYPDDYPEVQSYVPLTRAGFRILEVPVQMQPRQGGVSSISPVRAVYYMVKVGLATLMDALRPAPPKRGMKP